MENIQKYNDEALSSFYSNELSKAAELWRAASESSDALSEHSKYCVLSCLCSILNGEEFVLSQKLDQIDLQFLMKVEEAVNDKNLKDFQELMEYINELMEYINLPRNFENSTLVTVLLRSKNGSVPCEECEECGVYKPA